MKLTTTLNRIRACSPCASGWKTLLKALGETFDPDAEINLLTILESNGVADMLWTLRATVQESKRVASQLAIEFAEQALPIFEKHYPNDTRLREAIRAARDYLAGKITVEQLRACRSHAYAAYAAASAADASAADASAADAYAAYAAAAASAAASAAAASADASADAAAYAAASADASADAAYAAYAAAAADAADARKSARDKQAEIIRSILGV